MHVSHNFLSPGLVANMTNGGILICKEYEENTKATRFNNTHQKSIALISSLALHHVRTQHPYSSAESKTIINSNVTHDKMLKLTSAITVDD